MQILMNALICTNPGVWADEDQSTSDAANGQVLLRIRRIGIFGAGLYDHEAIYPSSIGSRVLIHRLTA